MIVDDFVPHVQETILFFLYTMAELTLVCRYQLPSRPPQRIHTAGEGEKMAFWQKRAGVSNWCDAGRTYAFLQLLDNPRDLWTASSQGRIRSHHGIFVHLTTGKPHHYSSFYYLNRS